MEPVKYIQVDLCWNEKQIRGATPEILFNLVHSVKESLKMQLGHKRTMTSGTDFDKITTDIQAEFGKWSHDFNFVLRQIIKEHELFESTQMVYKLKKYNIVYLYWWKCVTYLELLYNPLMHISLKKLTQATRLMEETYEHFINMPKEVPIELP